jgi:hypothetical protein
VPARIAQLRTILATLAGIFAACGLASDGKRQQTDVLVGGSGDGAGLGGSSSDDAVLGEGGAAGEAQNASSSESSGAGAEGVSELASAICPPLGTNLYGCLPGPTWARHLPTGTCCEYASYPYRCTPPGWPLFETEQECETSCRCAQVVPVFPDRPELDLTVERISLECACGTGITCYESLAAATAQLCGAPGASVLRQQKCGSISLLTGGGLGGGSYVFDAASGALVGATWSADTPRPPCGTFATIAGRDFESCTEPALSCILCGDPFGAEGLLPCQ